MPHHHHHHLKIPTLPHKWLETYNYKTAQQNLCQSSKHKPLDKKQNLEPRSSSSSPPQYKSHIWKKPRKEKMFRNNVTKCRSQEAKNETRITNKTLQQRLTKTLQNERRTRTVQETQIGMRERERERAGRRRAWNSTECTRSRAWNFEIPYNSTEYKRWGRLESRYSLTVLAF